MVNEFLLASKCFRKLKSLSLPLTAPCPSKVACMYIGFQINVLDFIPTIDMIHIDPSRKRPLWAHTKLLSITKYRQLRGEAMNYKEGTIFTGMIVNMSRLFDMDYQKGRFSRILNSNKLADKYINEFGGYTLTITHFLVYFYFFLPYSVSSEGTTH